MRSAQLKANVAEISQYEQPRNISMRARNLLLRLFLQLLNSCLTLRYPVNARSDLEEIFAECVVSIR